MIAEPAIVESTRHDPFTPGQRVLVVLAVIVVAITTSFHAWVGEPLVDLFQEGEYLAPRLFFPAGDHPLLIHGYIDYLPSMGAVAACGTPSAVACTRAVNAGCTMLAASAFLFCALSLGGSRRMHALAGRRLSKPRGGPGRAAAHHSRWEARE